MPSDCVFKSAPPFLPTNESPTGHFPGTFFFSFFFLSFAFCLGFMSTPPHSPSFLQREEKRLLHGNDMVINQEKLTIFTEGSLCGLEKGGQPASLNPLVGL